MHTRIAQIYKTWSKVVQTKSSPNMHGGKGARLEPKIEASSKFFSRGVASNLELGMRDLLGPDSRLRKIVGDIKVKPHLRDHRQSPGGSIPDPPWPCRRQRRAKGEASSKDCRCTTDVSMATEADLYLPVSFDFMLSS